MIEHLKTAGALLRAAFATSLLDNPDRLARASIGKLDAVMIERSQSLAESIQRMSRDL